MRKRFTLQKAITAILLFLLVIILPISVHHAGANADEKQKVAYSQTEFIQQIAPEVQEVAAYYGIRPSIIIAQAVLETNYGQTLLAVKYQNLFSLQASSSSDFIDLKNSSGQKVRFAQYRSWEESIKDYLARLKSGEWGDSLYQSLATETGYKNPAKALQNSSLTTNPDYANELIQIIENNQLTNYDK